MNTQANAMPSLVELMAMAQPTAQEPDANLRPWSELTESMTAAVAHHCRGQASVRLLEEGIGSVNSWEQDELCAAGDIYIRHIELSVAEVPRLIARSMVAADSPVVALMQGLSERPLAELLFTDLYGSAPPGLYIYRRPQIFRGELFYGVIKRISTNC